MDGGSIGKLSASGMFDPSLTDVGRVEGRGRRTLLTVTEAVYSVKPPSLSWTLPFTVREPLSFVGHEALLGPLNDPVAAGRSRMRTGSRRSCRRFDRSALVQGQADARSLVTDVGALKLAVGATLLMVTVAVYSVTPPSLSRTLPLTVREPLSVVGHARSRSTCGAVACAQAAVEGEGQAARRRRSRHRWHPSATARSTSPR